MKKTIFLLWASGLLPMLVLANGKDKDVHKDKGPLSVTDAFASGKYAAKAEGGFVMLKDGNYCKEDYDPVTKSFAVLEYSFEQEKPLDTLFSQKKAGEGLAKNFVLENFAVSDTKKYMLLQTATQSIYRHSKKAVYYIYDVATRKVQQVGQGKEVFYAGFSADEKKVAYVLDNNLYVQYINGEPTLQITHDGAVNNTINGKTDWVYEEEFAMSQGYEWSPAGDRIVYYKFDESKVKMYQLDYYDSLYPAIYKYKYPVAGEDNSKVSVWVYDLKTGQNKKLDLHEENDQYIPRIMWTRDDNTLAVERLNRPQNYFELIEASAPEWTPKTILTEQNKDYVEITDNLYFMKDNSFVMGSAKSGFYNIYAYDRNGNPQRNLTPYSYDVTNIIAVDEDNKALYYTSREPNPRNITVFQVKLDGTGKAMINSDEAGSTGIEMAADCKHYLMTTSSAYVPYTCATYRTGGSKIKVMEDNGSLKETLAQSHFSPKEFFDMKLSDSVTLSCWMIKPAHFKKHKKYPVLFTIYGGPGIQVVNDAWGGSLDIWYQYLANQGYIIVAVDNRGTGGKGEAFKQTTYKKLGQKESDDQIAAAKYMAALPYVDPARIGVYGWSFGGYMSAMLITKGADVFNTAISVAPVTDWRYYDNIYTERYMGMPKDNAANYDATSVFKYVPNLKGNLLLIYGTYDDNVHPQNSIMLIKKMVEQNKKFDAECYPNKNHGISGGYTRLHLYTRITEYILNHL